MEFLKGILLRVKTSIILVWSFVFTQIFLRGTSAQVSQDFTTSPQPLYGMPPQPPVLYGPPEAIPPRDATILEYLAWGVRLFAVPIAIGTVLIVGVVVVIKKLRKRKSKGPSNANKS